LAYSGSGLVIQGFARFHPTPSRLRTSRIASGLSARAVHPRSWQTAATSPSVPRLVGLPNPRGAAVQEVLEVGVPAAVPRPAWVLAGVGLGRQAPEPVGLERPDGIADGLGRPPDEPPDLGRPPPVGARQQDLGPAEGERVGRPQPAAQGLPLPGREGRTNIRALFIWPVYRPGRIRKHSVLNPI
jgi:hypothetical protein